VPGGEPSAAEGGKGCEGNWTVAGENLDFLAAGEDIFYFEKTCPLQHDFSLIRD